MVSPTHYCFATPTAGWPHPLPVGPTHIWLCPLTAAAVLIREQDILVGVTFTVVRAGVIDTGLVAATDVLKALINIYHNRRGGKGIKISNETGKGSIK